MSTETPIRIVVVDDHEVVRAGFAGLLATQPDFDVVGTAADGAAAVRLCAERTPDVVLMDVRMPGLDGIAATERILSAAEAAEAAGAAGAAEAGPAEPTDPANAGHQRSNRNHGNSGNVENISNIGNVGNIGNTENGANAGTGGTTRNPGSINAARASTTSTVAGKAPDRIPVWRPRVLILTTFDLDEHVYDALAAGASGFLLKDVTAERLFDAVRVVAAGEALLAPTVTRRLIGRFARMRPRAADGAPPELAALTPRETEVLRQLATGRSNPEIAARLTVTEETVKTHVSRVLSKLGLRDRTQAVVAAYESGLVTPGSGPPER